MKNEFVIGCDRAVITPKLGVLLYGYPQKRPADRVNDDLYANVAAFGNGNADHIWVGLDLCSFGTVLTAKTKKTISDTLGIAEENVIISVTHTHSGPPTNAIPGWSDSVDEEYLYDFLIPLIVELSEKAIKNAVPALLGVGETESFVGINRRELTEDGSVKLGQNPHGMFDKKMTILSFVTTDKKPILNIIHYGCHGTAAGGLDLSITRDWSGVMVDCIAKRTGAMTFYVNGAEGDVGPRLSNGKTTGDINLAMEMGEKAARDAVRAYETIEKYEEVTFKSVSDTIKIPYNPIEPAEEIKKQIAQLDSLEKLEGVNIIRRASLDDKLEFLKTGKEQETHLEINQTLVSFNSVAFVPFPFEMFSEIALRIRDFSPFANTLCTCNTNGALAYLPSQDQLCRGGYEVNQFRYRHMYSLVDNADDYAVIENLALLKKMNQL